MFKTPDPAIAALMKKAGSNDARIALDGQYEFAKALTLPLQQALLPVDNLDGIFTPIDRTGQSDLNYPLDFLNPGQEEDFIAYVQPGNGRIPERQVQADYIHLRTYMIANSIDILLRILRDANWDIMARMLEVIKAGFQMKMNRDGWRVALAAGASRNIVINDTAGAAGFFTRRLLSLMQIEMQRQGGVMTSQNRRKLTHLYTSTEAKHEIFNWDLTVIDDATRRELYMSQGTDSAFKIAGVNIVDLVEFGVGREYNNYYTSAAGLNQTLPNSDTEIVVGFDLTRNTFIMPIREQLHINVDPNMHRIQKAGMYGWFEGGYASLDNRDILVGSL